MIRSIRSSFVTVSVRERTIFAPAAEAEGTPAVKLKSFATNGLINSADASVSVSVLENTIEAADFTALIFSE